MCSESVIGTHSWHWKPELKLGKLVPYFWKPEGSSSNFDCKVSATPNFEILTPNKLNFSYLLEENKGYLIFFQASSSILTQKRKLVY